MMYWPKLVILMGIIYSNCCLLNAIFNNVNKNNSMNDNNDADTKISTTMKNANNTVKSVV